MRRVWLSVAVSGALAFAGCEKKAEPTRAADDDLTIVVQADRARIQGEEASVRKAIEEMREKMREEAGRLGGAESGTDDKVTEAQVQAAKRMAELAQQQQELTQRLQALAQQKDSLLEKAIARPEPSTPAAVPAAAEPQAAAPELNRAALAIATREKEMASREKSVAERERDLAERENALAGREAALAQRDSACLASAAAAKSEPERGQKVTRAAVDRAYRALRAEMDAKGLLLSDLPPSKQRQVTEASAARAAGDLGRAMDAIEQADATVKALSIDGDFVSHKVKRVNALQKKGATDAKAREEIARQLQDVTRAYSDGRFVDANRVLNNIVQLVEKGR